MATFKQHLGPSTIRSGRWNGVASDPGYFDAVRAVAAGTPMPWLAGNHDSPAVKSRMRTLPGVNVLGSTTQTADGSQVRAGHVDFTTQDIGADGRTCGADLGIGAEQPL